MITTRTFKSSKALTAIVAATLALAIGGNALAQDRGPGPGGPQQQRHDDRGNRFDNRGNGNDQRGFRPDPRGGRQDFRDGRQFDRAGFPQPHTEWRRGGRVPPEYRGRNYVVNDWRQYQLQAPPRGYQYVSVGGDYVLAAIATGIIANIIIGGR
jgi:Ni/Co efflux regulator RcnB